MTKPIQQISLQKYSIAWLIAVFTLFALPALAQDGANDPAFMTGFDPGTGFNGMVYTTTIQPDGKIIAVGDFTQFNGTDRSHIARLNADGSLDATFVPTGTGFNNVVLSTVVQPDGKIIVGGGFSSFNGTPRNRIARLNADGSLDATFVPTGTGFNSTVWSIALQPDGTIIAAGQFTDFNGTGRSHIARLNDDGSLDATFDPGTGFDGTVYTTAIQADGTIIAAGDFTDFNGTGRNSIARLNANGSLDTAFDPGTGFTSFVFSIAIQPDGKIIAGGDFTDFNGTPRNRVARLDADGSLDAAFDPGTGFNEVVYTTAIQPDGKIIVGGDFTDFNGTGRNRIARLNAGGSLDTSFDPGTGFNNTVVSIALQPDGKIIAGGAFTQFNSTGRNRIMRLVPNGADAEGFNSTVLSTVLQPDGKIIVGGAFTNFNGTGRNRITRLNADSSLDTTFVPTGTGFNNVVLSTALQSDGKIIVGGDFTDFNGTGRSRIARLNANGTLDATFVPTGTGFNSSVSSIAIQPNGKIIVGGAFSLFNGTLRVYIARLNADGTLDTDFDPGTGFNGSVFSTALQANGKIIVGGFFTAFNGTPRNRIARLNADGTLDAGFDPGTGFNNTVYTTAIQPNGKIIAGGDFSQFNDTERRRIARLNADGSLDPTFVPTGTGFNSSVWSTAIQSDGKIIAGGNFTDFNGTGRSRIARLNTNGSLDTGFDPGTGFNNAVYTTAIQPDGKIIAGGDFTDFNGTDRNRLARLLNAPPVPLPVTLVAFNAYKNGEGAQLIWATATEQNSEGFAIEHSTDGKEWSEIGFAPSRAQNGNSNLRLDYSFTDNSPTTGRNFYRLRQFDFDGRHEYSPIRSVLFLHTGGSISLYPNPVKEMLTLRHSEEYRGQQVQVTGISGREVMRFTLNNHSVQFIDVSRLFPGTYFFSLPNGEAFKVVKE